MWYRTTVAETLPDYCGMFCCTILWHNTIWNYIVYHEICFGFGAFVKVWSLSLSTFFRYERMICVCLFRVMRWYDGWLWVVVFQCDLCWEVYCLQFCCDFGWWGICYLWWCMVPVAHVYFDLFVVYGVRIYVVLGGVVYCVECVCLRSLDVACCVVM